MCAKTLIDDITDILLVEIFSSEPSKKINLGTVNCPDMKPVSIIKKIFDEKLNSFVIKEYIESLRKSGKKITRPTQYHIKGLYKTCVERCSVYQSENNYEYEII